MTAPISDSTLRLISGAFYEGGPLAPVPGLFNFSDITMGGERVCDLAELARSLLALREAVRALVDDDGVWFYGERPMSSLEAEERLRALLPKEPS